MKRTRNYGILTKKTAYCMVVGLKLHCFLDGARSESGQIVAEFPVGGFWILHFWVALTIPGFQKSKCKMFNVCKLK